MKANGYHADCELFLLKPQTWFHIEKGRPGVNSTRSPSEYRKLILSLILLQIPNNTLVSFEKTKHIQCSYRQLLKK